MGRAERDVGTARTVNISSELVLMHGARHGFRDSGARLASSPAAAPPPPPGFYYYWANITQALLIIHQHLSAKSHAEETRHPAAWREIKPSLRCIARLVLDVQNELCALITNYLHEHGVLFWKKMSSFMHLHLYSAPSLMCALLLYMFVSHPLMNSWTLSKKYHYFHALMHPIRKGKLQQPVRENVWMSHAMPE